MNEKIKQQFVLDTYLSCAPIPFGMYLLYLFITSKNKGD